MDETFKKTGREHKFPAHVLTDPIMVRDTSPSLQDKIRAAVLPTARKDDSAKLDMTLLDDMPAALAAVVEVMQWAITKKEPVPYVRGSWQGVHPDRYRAAIVRHNVAACEQAIGVTKKRTDYVGSWDAARFQRDEETNLLHLAHVACSALMALESTIREMRAIKDGV